MSSGGDAASYRSPEPTLLGLDPTVSMAAFLTLGGVLCAVIAWIPHDAEVRTGGLLVVAACACVVAGALLAFNPAPLWFRSLGAGAGTILICVAVYFGNGTGLSVGFAAFIVWTSVYAAVFFPPWLVAVHASIASVFVVTAWAVTGKPWLDLMLVLTAVVSTGLVLGELVLRARANAEWDRGTGLLTRQGLARRSAPLLPPGGETAALLLLQIRGLGQVVASLGHAAEEELMSRVGANLAGANPLNGIVIARIGTDRLAALLPAPLLALCQQGAVAAGEPDTPRSAAVWAAQQGLQLLRGPYSLAGVDLQLEGHVGVVLSDQVASGLPTLLRAAEAAVAEAARRDVLVEFYTAKLASAGSEQLLLLAELRAAIPAGQLRVYYQFQNDARTGRPMAVEALVRWQHPILGLLRPVVFLPMAEATDVIVDLTRAVLDEALRQCAQWLADGLRVPVSVNLSARLLTHKPLLEDVAAALATHGVPPELLTLEITETALVTYPDRAAVLVAALNARGMRTSLDDFGTGQTSLALLKDLHFDELKIDRSFITAMQHDPRAESIVRSMIYLAHGLGQTVVAEGVEDESTCRWLADLGCDLLQGFYFGQPLPAAALTGLPLRTAAALVPADDPVVPA